MYFRHRLLSRVSVNMNFELKSIKELRFKTLLQVQGKTVNGNNLPLFMMKRVFLVFMLIMSGWCYINAQTADLTVIKLVNMGFENVRWTEDQDERVYVIENTAYRLNGIGIGKAIDLIRENGMPKRKKCRVIVTNNNIPQLSLICEARTDSIEREILRSDWNTTYTLGNNWRNVKKKQKENSSLFKVDIVVYPELSLKNLVITQIYQVLFNISPAIEVSLWDGMKLVGQIIIPVYNDGYASPAHKVRPGFVSLSQDFRLPGNVFGTASIGTFNADRYGVDLKMFYPLCWLDERVSLEGRVSATKSGMWDGFEYGYGKRTDVTWSLGGNLYWDRYNTQLSMKLEKYIFNEKAIRCEMIRHFRYTSIAFYFAKANDDDISLSYGFRFQVALPPYKYKRNKYYPRVIPSRNMGMNYNGSNERFYYKTFRTRPEDNIMQQNSFNPYFIKSELLNF